MNDSIDRIKEDSLKFVEQYWNCANVYTCEKCPSKIGEQKPYEYYETLGCSGAMQMDIIERTVKVMESNMERTCHMKLLRHGANYDLFYFDCCDKEYAENRNDNYASCISGDVCPYCGAKVVK